MHGVPTVREQDMPLLFAITNTKIPVPLQASLNGVLLNQLLLLRSTLQRQRLHHHLLYPMLLQIVNQKLVVSLSEHAVVIQPLILIHGSLIPLVQNT